MRVPVLSRVVRTIDPAHKLVECVRCRARHVMEVKPGGPDGRGWRSLPGGRDCTNPSCKDEFMKLQAQAAAQAAKSRDHFRERQRILDLPADEYDLAAEISLKEL